MSQHDYSIANGSGAAVRGDINTALGAILTSNSGPSAPTVTAPFMPWYDTVNGVLWERNAADSAWVPAAPGRLLNIQVFKTAGSFTFNKTPGASFGIVKLMGGGGGGAGSENSSAGYAAIGYPGAHGAYLSYTVPALPGTASIVVGAAGTQGAAFTSGGAGGNSSFGSPGDSWYGVAGGGPGGVNAGGVNTFPYLIYRNKASNPTIPTGGTILANLKSICQPGLFTVLGYPPSGLEGGVFAIPPNCPENFPVGSAGALAGVGGSGVVSANGIAGQAAPSTDEQKAANGFAIVFEYS